MKKIYFRFFAIFLTTISIVLLTILIFMKSYAFKNGSRDLEINEKVLSEIDFVDSCIIEAMNKLNNISSARYKIQTKSLNKSEENNTNSENESKNKSNNSEKSEQSEENKKESPDSSEDEEKQSQTNSQVKKLESESKEDSDSNSSGMSVSKSIATNSLTETTESNINWDEITYIYENLYATWPTISIDLKEIGIKEEQLNQFNLALNGVAQSINSKDKNSALVNLFNIYTQLPNYVRVVTQDSYLIITYNTKVSILNAYTLANEENKWKEIGESVAKAKSIFSKMYEIVEEDDKRKASVDKTNTIINDFENSIVLNDKNIFYMQYKNTIQALETL